jgi:peroxiredoxin
MKETTRYHTGVCGLDAPLTIVGIVTPVNRLPSQVFKMKKACIVVSIILTVLCIALFRINLEQSAQIKRLQASLPYLLPGQTITYLDLIGTENQTIDSDTLVNSKDKIFLIYIFQQPCNPCNKNLYMWRKMAEILKNDVEVIGVILDDLAEARAFKEKGGLNFNLYVPRDVKRFKKEMRINLNMAQTILSHRGKVVYISAGNIQGNDYTSLLTAAKKIRGS